MGLIQATKPKRTKLAGSTGVRSAALRELALHQDVSLQAKVKDKIVGQIGSTENQFALISDQRLER